MHTSPVMATSTTHTASLYNALRWEYRFAVKQNHIAMANNSDIVNASHTARVCPIRIPAVPNDTSSIHNRRRNAHHGPELKNLGAKTREPSSKTPNSIA